jgi:hypothetical protein
MQGSTTCGSLVRSTTWKAAITACLSALSVGALAQVTAFPSAAQLAAGAGGAYVSVELAINPCMPIDETDVLVDDIRVMTARAQASWPKGLCDNPPLAQQVPTLSYLERSILAVTDEPFTFIAEMRAFHRQIDQCPTSDCILAAMQRRSTELRPKWDRLVLDHPGSPQRNNVPQPLPRRVPHDVARQVDKLDRRFIAEHCPADNQGPIRLYHGFFRLGPDLPMMVYGSCTITSTPPLFPTWLAEPAGGGRYRIILNDPSGNCRALPKKSRSEKLPPLACTEFLYAGSLGVSVLVYTSRRYEERLGLDILWTAHGMVTLDYDSADPAIGHSPR